MGTIIKVKFDGGSAKDMILEAYNLDGFKVMCVHEFGLFGGNLDIFPAMKNYIVVDYVRREDDIKRISNSDEFRQCMIETPVQDFERFVNVTVNWVGIGQSILNEQNREKKGDDEDEDGDDDNEVPRSRSAEVYKRGLMSRECSAKNEKRSNANEPADNPEDILSKGQSLELVIENFRKTNI